MELDELKASWETLSRDMEKQQLLNAKLIHQMISQKYKSRINSIGRYEWIGTIISFIMAGVICWNFNTLDTWLLRIFGIITIVLLIVLPLLSLRSIKGLHSINISLPEYQHTLRDFALQKIRFQKFQKINVYMSFLLVITSAPIAVKIMAGKDISQNLNMWLIMLPISALVLIVFSRWVLKHYNNSLHRAEELLAEMQSA